MRYVSLFSGIEAASVAWGSLGWEPAAFAEIDPFACAVLAEHFPDVANLGDVRAIDWSEYAGTVDLVVGGSPCQAFSIAGRREGLMDERGQLMYEYIRAVRELRPRWVIWENVPGVLSQSRGDALEALFSELEQCGYSLAWRTLDAQFFGVAQRRRRVFVVGHARAGCAAAVLFEREVLRRSAQTSREKREELTRASECGATCVLPLDLGQVTSAANRSRPQWNDPAPTLAASSQPPCVYLGFAYNAGGSFAPTLADISPSLRAARCGENAVICIADDTAHDAIYKDLAGTLKVGGMPPAVVVPGSTYAIRRLTPVECERLQGFPDGWTDVTYRESPARDSPRYKALGNSMAVPVMRWIGERIAQVDEIARKEEKC